MKTAKKVSRPSGAISITNAPVSFIPYQREVFRAFATVQPTQSLLDDLVETSKEQKTLEAFYYLDEISPAMSPGERVYRRSDQQVIQEEISSKFHPRQWYISRYSDSTWPVLYSAETEETALRESLFHKRKFYWEELKRKSIQLDLRIAALEVTSDRCQDLLQTKGLDETKLISNDESGYPYCQALAKYYRERGADLFRTPSARHEKGICIPIFAIEVITQDKGHLKYAKCVLRSEGAEVFEGKFSIYF